MAFQHIWLWVRCKQETVKKMSFLCESEALFARRVKPGGTEGGAAGPTQYWCVVLLQL